MERLMSFPGTIEAPEIRDSQTGNGENWIVTVYNNDYNTHEEVVEILIVATGCPVEEAEIETWEVHFLGKSVVHHGRQDACKSAADIIGQIGIRVEVSEE
jgi:ATP-dependent Clp protease adapter protein ClpS